MITVFLYLSLDFAGHWLIDPFKETPIGQLLISSKILNGNIKLLNHYTHDFVYMAYQCISDTEHWVTDL